MPERREILWASFLLALLVTALFAGRWIHGSSIYFSIVEEGFPVVANYPWDRFVSGCLGMGRFPLWNPYQSCGNTFIANYLPAFFFLPRWILYMSDGVAVRDFFVLMRFWLGGTFLYLFLRRISLKAPGAALATAAFMLGGYFTRYYNETYLNIDLFLGLWLLAGEELVRRKSIGATIAAGLAVLAVLLGGHPSSALHALAIMGFWVVYRSVVFQGAAREKTGAVVLFALACAGALAAASVQIIPFIEAMSIGINYHIPNLGRYHYELKHLASLAYPWIYGNFSYHLAIKSVPLIDAGTSYGATTINWLPPYLGILPLVFAGAAVLRFREGNPAIKFFAAYLLVALGGVFGFPPFNWVFTLPPLYSQSNYKHLFPEITLCASVLAGMGLNVILETDRRRSIAALAVSAAAVLSLGLYAAHKTSSGKYVYVIFLGVLPVAAVLAAALIRKGKALAAVSIGLTCLMGYFYTSGYNAHDEGYLLGLKDAPFVKYLESRIGDDRYTSLYPPLVSSFAPYLKIADVRGHDALQPRAYWKLLSDVNGGGIRELTTFYYTFGGFSLFPGKLGDPRLESIRLKYIVSPADLGGTIAVAAMMRAADVKARPFGYFHWNVWDVDEDRRPVLFTHPPIKLEVNYTLPEDADRLETALAWSPDVNAPGRDGAFVLVMEEKDGVKKTVYARYMPPDEKNWVRVPIPAFPDHGVKRTIIVNPLSNNFQDWLGWGIRNRAGVFWGYQPAFQGSVAEKSAQADSAQGNRWSDEWNSVSVYEKPFIEPLFSLSDRPDPGLAARAFPARRVAPDEYLFNNNPYLRYLEIRGFNYRPGWRLFGEREIKLNLTAPFDLYADLGEIKEDEYYPLRLVYVPWGFRAGLWVSITCLISLLIIIAARRKKGDIFGAV